MRQGRYSFTSVAPGTYVVEVQAKGFQRMTSPVLTHAGAGNVTQDFTHGAGRRNASR